MDKIILGIDEAGRGPLAGRVYAAAVILNPENNIEGLNDSKKLTHKKRKALSDKIKENAQAWHIAYATPEEIDSINILQATFLAMRRALEGIDKNFNFVLIDGNHYPFTGEYDGEPIIKGDSKVLEIMAASILAKVERDEHMLLMDEKYPQFNFAGHKGYPTKKHRELIREHGPSPIHRKSFKGVKEYINPQQTFFCQSI